MSSASTALLYCACVCCCLSLFSRILSSSFSCLSFRAERTLSVCEANPSGISRIVPSCCNALSSSFNCWSFRFLAASRAGVEATSRSAWAISSFLAWIRSLVFASDWVSTLMISCCEAVISCVSFFSSWFKACI